MKQPRAKPPITNGEARKILRELFVLLLTLQDQVDRLETRLTWLEETVDEELGDA